MRYRIIGIDLDGTLLDGSGRVSQRNREAICAAHEAGAVVVPCTGRGWIESRHLLAPIPDLDIGVFVTGAQVSEVSTGRLLDGARFDPNVAMDVIKQLQHLPEAVLTFRDRQHGEHDYLITGEGELTDNTLWWFDFHNVAVIRQRIVEVSDLGEILRIGCVADGQRLRAVVDRLRSTMGDQIEAHSFAAIQQSDTVDGLHVMEVFARGVDKWRGLSWIARRHQVGADQVAAIGDQVNDLSMLIRAGCGIAMANAAEEVQSAADYVTGSNDDDGVAWAIEKLISSQWG